MAWTISTYAGTRATGDPSNWRTAMFELCRAVNERQAAVGIAKTQFYKSDGTLGSDLTMADLEDFRWTGEWTGQDAAADTNLIAIQNAIKAMLSAGYFTTTTGGKTTLTQAAVESSIGTDLDSDPIKPTEARFWQAQQDALDLMIYGKFSHSVAYGSSTFLGRKNGISSPSTNPPPSQTNAWADLVADSGSPDSIYDGQCLLEMESSYLSGAPDYYTFATLAYLGNEDVPIPTSRSTALLGTLTALDYVIRWFSDHTVNHSDPVDESSFTGTLSLDVGSATASRSNFAQGTQRLSGGNPAGYQDSETINATLTDISFGSGTLNYLDTTLTVPGTNPFSLAAPSTAAPLGNTRRLTVYGKLIQVNMYFDIASELTDQA